MRIITLAIILLFLSGCGITTPQNVGNAHKLTLSPLNSNGKSKKKLGNIVLEFPKANTELDTYRVALLRDGGKRDYFAGVRWADFLPSIIQSTMVESLQNSGRFESVTADYTNFYADYQLRGDIKLFQADYTQSNPPTIVIKIQLSLVNLSTLKVIKNFTVTKKQQAAASNISSIHESFDSVFSAAQEEILQQIIETLRHRAEP